VTAVRQTYARSAGALLAAAALANAAGYAFTLWDRVAWFDEVIHGFTLFAITLPLGLAALGPVVNGTGDRALWAVLTIASMGLAVGALWEVAEWAYDQWAAGNVILGKTDTIVDLIADSVGALLGAWLSVAWHARGR
jgi:VanZ family protein